MRNFCLKISLVVIGLMGFMGLLPLTAYALNCNPPANTADAIQCGSDNSAGVPVSQNPTDTLNKTVTSVVNVLSIAVGVAAVIMIIVGGFRYITISGNEQAVSSAKKTILYALVGLAVAVLAQLIVQFVLNKSTQI